MFYNRNHDLSPAEVRMGLKKNDLTSLDEHSITTTMFCSCTLEHSIAKRKVTRTIRVELGMRRIACC